MKLAMNCRHSQSRASPSASGFTLAELIVAAGVTALTILALVGVVRKGTEITYVNQHRQRARAVIDSCFECPAYSFRNYDNLPGANGTPVLIDERDKSSAADDLPGTLNILVSIHDTNKTPLPNPIDPARDYVEYKTVTMTVSWQEPGIAQLQSVALRKFITRLPDL